VPSAEKLRMVENIATLYYRAQQYALAVPWYQRYFKDGGTSNIHRGLMAQALYLSGDGAAAAKELTAEIQASEKNGGAPAEDRLILLMQVALQQTDIATENFALERLVHHYPKKEYWGALMSHVQNNPRFSEHLTLDAYRLSLATNSLDDPQDYMEMAQLAFQAGQGTEALKVLNQGYASGALGTGAEAQRHHRLRDLISNRLAEARMHQSNEEKQAISAPDGNKLLTLGFNKVLEGQATQGLSWMAQGMRKGSLQRPELAKLHHAIAQFTAGNTSQAQATFQTIKSPDGTGDLARLWLIHARRGKN
jgi:hypothetical protein